MADKSVKLTIYADASQLKRALGDVDGGLGATGTKVGGFSDLFKDKWALIGAAAVTGGAVVVAAMSKMAIDGAKWLLDLGEAFDDATDNIRINVGNNVALNTALESSLERLYGKLPSGLDDVSTAVATLNSLLGTTGQPLEDIATAVLNLSRITGTDLATNVNAAAQLFNNWNVPAEESVGVLDELFRAMQVSNVPFSTLADDLNDSGVQLRALGFSLPETTALIAQLAKYGLDISDVLPAMSRSMATAAKQGKPLAAAFDATVTAIKTAPDEVTAMQKAIEIFGTRAGPKLAGLIREGKFSIEDLYGAIATGSDTIANATTDTDDWKEHWAVAWHNVQLAAKPAADWLFGALGDITGALIGDDGQINLAGAWDVVIAKWNELKPKIEAWWNNTVVPWWENTAKPWINDTLIPAMEEAGRRMAEGLFNWLPGAVENFTEEVGKHTPQITAAGAAISIAFLKGFGKGLKDNLGPVAGALEVVPVVGPMISAANRLANLETGGLLPKGLTLVGERGPEVLDNRGAGRVFSAEQSRGMSSGGPVIHNHIYVGGRKVDEQISRGTRQYERARR